ncbi:MAG: TIR domain-containing protein [Marinobacter sp.]|jgi:hypothetical protein|uniref:TIR domain-containing protein n=1 Tax=Marinobacter sp. TaxID=50741 RepID=UPI003298548C|tara:strand:+ start:246 stop:737 length:492 start_codon:yes stop_codon:yes gene_type:complete
MSTYVIFDGDNDQWAYQYVRGWDANPKIPFSFNNSHDLNGMTSAAQNEAYVKTKLRERMKKSDSALVLIGEKTKNLYKFVRWEIDLAIELELPIIAVNLNNSRSQDELCPPIIRDKCVVHVPFKLRPIQHAILNWPREFKGLDLQTKAGGARHFNDDLYRQWE